MTPEQAKDIARQIEALGGTFHYTPMGEYCQMSWSMPPYCNDCTHPECIEQRKRAAVAQHEKTA